MRKIFFYSLKLKFPKEFEFAEPLFWEKSPQFFSMKIWFCGGRIPQKRVRQARDFTVVEHSPRFLQKRDELYSDIESVDEFKNSENNDEINIEDMSKEEY